MITVSQAEVFRPSRGRDRSAAVETALEAMRQVAPVQVRRARHSLAHCMQAIRNSRWPEVAWEFSRLTADGFPLEFAFGSSDAECVRYACEVSGPEEREETRVARACDTYRLVSGESFPLAIQTEVEEMQRGHPLEYGAWLGMCHGREYDDCKLYAEVPRTVSKGPRGSMLFGEERALCPDDSWAVMVGYSADRQIREIYFHSRSLEEADLGRLLWSCGIGHRHREMTEVIREAGEWATLPPAFTGCSIARAGNAGVCAVAVFASAWVLFGSDANIRRTLLRLGKRRGWNLDAYEAVTRPMQSCDSAAVQHGIFACIATPAAEVEIRIGVRPPDLCRSPRAWPDEENRDQGGVYVMQSATPEEAG